MHPYTSEQIAALQKEGKLGATANGAVGGSLPSASHNTKTLDHNEFQMAYPDDWKVYGDQNSAVTIAPASGVSDNAIAYGVMVNGYQPEGSVNLDQATNELVSSLRQSNPDMRAIGHGEDIRVNGVGGKSIDLVGTSPIKQDGKSVSERDWLVALPRRDGSLLYMVFIAPDQDFSRMRPTFEQMLKSVKLK